MTPQKTIEWMDHGWFWCVRAGADLLARSARSYDTEAEAEAAWQEMILAVLQIHCEGVPTTYRRPRRHRGRP